MDPEYCLLSQERNPVREKERKIFVYCTFGWRVPHGPPPSHATGYTEPYLRHSLEVTKI